LVHVLGRVLLRCGIGEFVVFSSRRRHTRSKRDWSSDVCSSDLPGQSGVTPWVTPRSDLGRAGGDRAGACHPVTPHQGYPAWSRPWSVSSASATMPNLPCPSWVSRPTSPTGSISFRNHERARIPHVTRSLKSGAQTM